MSESEPDVSDAELIRLARSGASPGFDALVRRWGPAFRGAALRLLSYHPHDAEEAVQETWFQIHRDLESLEDPTKGRAWAYSILRNTCLKLRNRRRQERDLVSSPPVTDDPSDPPAACEGTLRRLAEAIQRMPDAYREATILRYQQKLSYAEVARVLGVAVGTAKSNVARGIGWLEKNLKPEGSFDE